MAIQTMETGFLKTKKAEPRRSEPLQAHLHAKRSRTETMLLQCEVMFGSPSSNCSGNGICKIVAKSDSHFQTFRRTSCSHAKALITPMDKNGRASLIFPREWLCSHLMRQHFRHGIFEMPEPCPIPLSLVSALHLKIKELPSGLHLIEDHGSYYRINFCRNDT